MRYNQVVSSPAEQPQPATTTLALPHAERRRLTWEIWLVLGLSLGRSAVYAIVALIDAYSRGPIGQQTTTLNPSQSTRPWFDLTYQLLSIFFALLPVLLALYLLSSDRLRGPVASVRTRLGIDASRPWQDAGWGLVLGAIIGIPGLGLYLLGRSLGITVGVNASGLTALWWTVPVLILASIKNGVLEEFLVIGYLGERLGQLQWRTVTIIGASALMRASYHLYQGWGPFAGNLVMGIIFASFYFSKWGRKRVWPLVIAHSLIDIVAFVGYAYLPQAWLAALGLA